MQDGRRYDASRSCKPASGVKPKWLARRLILCRQLLDEGRGTDPIKEDPSAPSGERRRGWRRGRERQRERSRSKAAGVPEKGRSGGRRAAPTKTGRAARKEGSKSKASALSQSR